MSTPLRRDTLNQQFESLLESTQLILEGRRDQDPAYFSTRTPTQFEEDVFAAMKGAAEDTPFANQIKLVSGHKFPDITAGEGFGVEVKTAKNSWSSTGNSVLESTRVEGVEEIYLFFGNIGSDTQFKWRSYENCLVDVKVTHSPRYIIDMNLEDGKSVFEKMGQTYMDIQESSTPIREFVRYYRSLTDKGSEPWWMEGLGDQEEGVQEPLRSWQQLSKDKQDELIVHGMARFPEIFGNQRDKYRRLASWLVSIHHVVDSSVRDKYSAKGKTDIKVRNSEYKDMPRKFENLRERIPDVLQAVRLLDPEDAKYYWQYSEEIEELELVKIWAKLVFENSRTTLRNDSKLIVHLLVDTIGYRNSPDIVREASQTYSLGYSDDD